MKKFFGKLFLVLLPVWLFGLWFLLFEPYNYWGIKGDYSCEWTKPLAKVRKFLRDPSPNVILGDSRMLRLDPDRITAASGKKFQNMSTGGQNINLTLELYEWLKSKQHLEEIVMDVSFWQVKSGHYSDSAQPVFYIAEHPLDYMVTRDYVYETYKNFQSWIKKPVNFFRQDTIPYIDVTEHIEKTPSGYRQDILDYTLNNIYPSSQKYQLNQDYIADLKDMMEDADQSGTEMTVIIPPVQRCIWEYVIHPLNLEPMLAEYKNQLSKIVKLYDLEWENEFSDNQYYYTDGFHFDTQDGCGIIADLIGEIIHTNHSNNSNLKLVPKCEKGA